MSTPAPLTGGWVPGVWPLGWGPGAGGCWLLLLVLAPGWLQLLPLVSTAGCWLLQQWDVLRAGWWLPSAAYCSPNRLPVPNMPSPLPAACWRGPFLLICLLIWLLTLPSLQGVDFFGGAGIGARAAHLWPAPVHPAACGGAAPGSAGAGGALAVAGSPLGWGSWMARQTVSQHPPAAVARFIAPACCLCLPAAAVTAAGVLPGAAGGVCFPPALLRCRGGEAAECGWWVLADSRRDGARCDPLAA